MCKTLWIMWNLTMNPVAVGVRTIFAVLALVAFVLAGLGAPEKPSIRYLGWGLAFLTLAFFLSIVWR